MAAAANDPPEGVYVCFFAFFVQTGVLLLFDKFVQGGVSLLFGKFVRAGVLILFGKFVRTGVLILFDKFVRFLTQLCCEQMRLTIRTRKTRRSLP